MKGLLLLFLFVFALIWGTSVVISFIASAQKPILPDFTSDSQQEMPSRIQQSMDAREERMRQKRIRDDLKFEMQKQQGMMPGSSHTDMRHQQMMEKMRLQGHQQYHDTIPPRVPGHR